MYIQTFYRPLLFLCLLASAVLPIATFAQARNVLLENIGVEGGLAQATVNFVFQDREGFVWVSTESGVQTYDGYNFKNIAGPDGDFANFSAHKIDESDDGLIWLDVYGKGLYTFDKQTQSYELVLKTEEENSISYFHFGANEKIWISTISAIGYLDRQTKAFVKEYDLIDELGPKNFIYHIFEYQNTLFISTDNGVYVYNLQTKQILKLPPINFQNTTNDNFSIAEAVKAYALIVIEQTLYIGTNDGVFNLDISEIAQFFKQNNPIPQYNLVIPHTAVWQFYPHENVLLVGANEGLYELNLESNQSRYILSYDLYNLSIANNFVRTLMVDDNGIYWMGSLSDGLFMWDPKSADIQTYGYQKNSKSSLTNNHVTAVLKHNSQPNLLWVGTINGLNLVDLDGQVVERIVHPVEINSAYNQNYIYDISYGPNEQLWLSTAVGLLVYDTISKTLQALPFEDSINQLFSSDLYVAHVENNYLWYSTETNLFRINLSNQDVDNLSEISASVGAGNVWALLGHITGDPNEFWFTTSLGVWKFNLLTRQASKVYQHPQITDGNWSNIDNVLVDQKAGMLWIAFTMQGLIGVSLETQKVVTYLEQNNSIIGNSVYGVQQDKDGDLWVATHDGLFLLDTQSLHLRRFSVKDGLVGNELNGNAYTVLNNGKMVYGAMNGLSIFDPIQLKSNITAKPKKIIVTDINLLSRDIQIPFYLNDQDRVELRYDDVGISVDFTTFDFSQNKDAQFEYSLNGQKFNPLSNNRIVFPTLPSGTHTLQIRAKSKLSGEYSPPSTLTFEVSHALWRSPYAYTFYTLLFLSLLAYWLQKREQQRKELLRAHEQVKFRENRLQLALIGSNSEVWDWHAQTNKFSAKRFRQLHNTGSHFDELSFADFYSHMHPDDGAGFVGAWQRFIDKADTTETFSCTYRLKGAPNEWLWYKDIGKIVELDNHNRPLRVTGSYTNITQSKVDEERAQYYGEAFRQTKDWVIIINQDFSKVTSNAAIRSVFGWEQEEFAFDRTVFGFSREKMKFYTEIVLSLGADQHWRGEDLITTTNGQDFHVIVNISVGSNRDGNLHYIFVFTDITAQKTAENELRYMANYDHLTDLPNRALLFERVERAIVRAARKQSNIALFFIDLDRFKNINDTLGHDYGDILLIEVAKRLTHTLRQDDTIARQGGDEFVVLLERFSSLEKLAKIAQKIIDSIEEPIHLKEKVVSIGCSIGIAIYPDDGMTSIELFKNSDIAMYSAKQQGRNNYQFFEKSMNDAAAHRLMQEAKIKQAIKDNQFINHYQPIVDAHTGKAVGVEMLMRWPTTEGMVPPDEFIPLAEELNLIIAMTETALQPAFADLLAWREHRPDFYLSINISANHFIRGQLVDFMVDALKLNSLPASAIKFEVTETAFISQPEVAIEQMTRLKNLGFELSLDDFGTGYSSLSYLKSLPIDVIKIDRSFINSIGNQKANEAIIETIINLAANLDMSCIAEGVETKEQIAFLVARKCHFIQGYFYSKPLVNDAVLSMLKDNLDAYSQTF